MDVKPGTCCILVQLSGNSNRGQPGTSFLKVENRSSFSIPEACDGIGHPAGVRGRTFLSRHIIINSSGRSRRNAPGDAAQAGSDGKELNQQAQAEDQSTEGGQPGAEIGVAGSGLGRSISYHPADSGYEDANRNQPDRRWSTLLVLSHYFAPFCSSRGAHNVQLVIQIMTPENLNSFIYRLKPVIKVGKKLNCNLVPFRGLLE